MISAKSTSSKPKPFFPPEFQVGTPKMPLPQISSPAKVHRVAVDLFDFETHPSKLTATTYRSKIPPSSDRGINAIDFFGEPSLSDETVLILTSPNKSEPNSPKPAKKMPFTPFAKGMRVRARSLKMKMEEFEEPFAKDIEFRAKTRSKMRWEDFEDLSPKRNRFKRQLPNSRYTPRKKRLVQEPQIILNKFIFNGKKYPVSELGSGVAHKVFAFTCSKVIEFEKDKFISSEMVILRTRIPNCDPKKIAEIQNDDYIAYDEYIKNNIPVPTCYVRPDKFTDTKDPKNGNFWLLEKMAEQATTTGWQSSNRTFEELSEKDQETLEFVHSWIKKSYQSKTDLVPDFYPRNVMRDAQGKLVVVDFALSTGSWQDNLAGYIKGWSDQNEEIKKYLETALVD